MSSFDCCSKRNAIAVLIIVAIILVLSEYVLVQLKSKHTIPLATSIRRRSSRNMKTILFWNDFFGVKNIGNPSGAVAFKGCRVSNCALWDRVDQYEDLPVEDYDALIFHGIDTGAASIQDLPPFRRVNQRYIFMLHESPVMRPEFYNLDNFFNWTATYRRDSDILLPYVNIEDKFLPRRKNNLPKVWRQPSFYHLSDFADIVANKTKLVVWFVSNHYTYSKRDVYVRILSKYISVDEYGKNGKYHCSKDPTCDSILDATYKFYLAFENSLCVDYVTEKLTRALSHNLVPVVYGGADYSAFAPPLSYINVKDFASPKDLAEYLHYLDRNPQEYVKYFWWKKFYYLDSGNWLCDLCEKLNSPLERTKTYPSMDSWWNYQGVCVNPKIHFLGMEE